MNIRNWLSLFNIHSRLCNSGIYSWELFVMSITYQEAFPEQSHIGRRCIVCGRLEQLSDDKKRWDHRV